MSQTHAALLQTQQEQVGVQPDTADGPWKQVSRHGRLRRSHRACHMNLTEPGSRSSMHQQPLAAPSTARKGSVQPSANSTKAHGLHMAAPQTSLQDSLLKPQRHHGQHGGALRGPVHPNCNCRRDSYGQSGGPEPQDSPVQLAEATILA